MQVPHRGTAVQPSQQAIDLERQFGKPHPGSVKDGVADGSRAADLTDVPHALDAERMASDAGLDVLNGKRNYGKARRALEEAGYKGERVGFVSAADYFGIAQQDNVVPTSSGGPPCAVPNDTWSIQILT